MKVVFHFDGTDSLRAKLGDAVLCPESDAAAFEKLLPEMEVLWHVLQPVTAEVIAKAPKLKLIQKIGSGVNTIDVEAAKRRGIAVSSITDGHCAACQVRLRPQLIMEARKGDRVVQCESCSRILYVPPTAAPVPEAAGEGGRA